MESLLSAKVARPRVSKTKQLARELGLLPAKRKALAENKDKPGKRRKGQLLTYLIVIDFESTCWKDKRSGQEIIEFPAVLLDLSNGKITQEFHHFVLPTEYPTLSTFCKELTGITQTQVNNGIPLPTGLYLFNQWIRKLRDEMGVVLMEPGQEYTERDLLCAIVTWSDWDLEVCLHHECSRKQIRKPACFRQWIDIRAVYRTFYERKPQGLNGALEDLGIKFIGRQHSGIDDAKNTAKLCYRMVRDGCRLTITKCIHNLQQSRIKPPSCLSRQPLNNATPNTELNAKSVILKCLNKENVPEKCGNATSTTTLCSAAQIDSKPATTAPSLSSTIPSPSTQTVSSKQASHCLLRATPCPVAHTTSSVKENHDTKLTMESGTAVEKCVGDNGNVVGAGSPALLSSAGQEDWADVSGTDLFCEAALEMDRWEREFEQMGSASDASAAPVLSNSPGNLLHVPGASAHPDTTTPLRSQFVTHVAPVTLLPPGAVLGKWELPVRGFFGVDKESLRTPENGKTPGLPGASPSGLVHGARGCLAAERSPEGDSPLLFPTENHSGHQQGYTPCKQGITVMDSPNLVAVEETPPSEQGTASPRAVSRSGRNDSNPNLEGHAFKTPNISRWLNSKRCMDTFSPTSPVTPSGSVSNLAASGGKITPPLCGCGRRAKRKLVCSPGPNEGLPFYVCPNSRGNDRKRGCNFFKWEKYATDCSSDSKPLVSDYSDCR